MFDMESKTNGKYSYFLLLLTNHKCVKLKIFYNTHDKELNKQNNCHRNKVVSIHANLLTHQIKRDIKTEPA